MRKQGISLFLLDIEYQLEIKNPTYFDRIFDCVLMHLAQALTFCSLPSTMMTVFWTLGSQRLFVFRWEWETLWPVKGFLPQT